MIRKTPALAATALLFLALSAGLPAANAEYHSCNDDDSGAGDEDARCTLTCEADQSIGVYASVDEPGAVYGSVQCGSTTAGCQGALRCTGRSNPNTTSSSGTGPCSASGNGGWFTTIDVSCWSEDATDPSPPDTDPIGAIQALVETLVSLPQVEDAVGKIKSTKVNIESSSPPGVASLAAIRVVEGVATGVSCSAGECRLVVPQCEVLGQAWRCSI